MCGFPPFYDDDNDKLFELIARGKVEFPSPYWDNISDQAKDLIRKLLTVDPKKRPNSDEILAHVWMVGDATPRKNLPNITDKIREYNAKKKFKVILIKRLEKVLTNYNRRLDLWQWLWPNGAADSRTASKNWNSFLPKTVVFANSAKNYFLVY